MRKHGILKNTDIFFKLKYAINFTNINPSVSLLTFKAPVIIKSLILKLSIVYLFNQHINITFFIIKTLC